MMVAVWSHGWSVQTLDDGYETLYLIVTALRLLLSSVLGTTIPTLQSAKVGTVINCMFPKNPTLS